MPITVHTLRSDDPAFHEVGTTINALFALNVRDIVSMRVRMNDIKKDVTLSDVRRIELRNEKTLVTVAKADDTTAVVSSHSWSLDTDEVTVVAMRNGTRGPVTNEESKLLLLRRNGEPIDIEHGLRAMRHDLEDTSLDNDELLMNLFDTALAVLRFHKDVLDATLIAGQDVERHADTTRVLRQLDMAVIAVGDMEQARDQVDADDEDEQANDLPRRLRATMREASLDMIVQVTTFIGGQIIARGLV